MRSIAFAWVVAFLSVASPLHAAPGDLDPTFGIGGFAALGAAPNLTAFDAGGGLLVVGGNTVARFTPNGILDTSWGINGAITVNVSGVNELNGIAVQPDGKVLVATEATFATPGFIVVRYASDGTLDASFGTGGVARTLLLVSYGQWGTLAVQPDGGIIVGGTVFDAANTPGAALARLLPDGTLDTSFGINGFAVPPHPFMNVPEYARRLQLQPDGAILVADLNGVVRWLPDGTQDTSFGSGGFIPLSFPSFPPLDNTDFVALAPDGKVLVAGPGVTRFDPDGSLDAGFGTGGVAHPSDSSGALYVSAVALQPDGKILVGTSSAIVRLLPSGTLDPTFGRAGIESLRGALHIAVRSDGLILASNVAFLGGECGNGIVERGEDCDDGNVVGGDGCDAHCCVADADGDGVCDGFDLCSAGVPVTKAAVKFSADSRTFTAAIETVLPVPFTPALDPILHGFRIVVAGSGDSTPIDFVAAGGAYAAAAMSGWTGSSILAKWKWVNRNSRGFIGNIAKITVQDRSLHTPGLVRVTVQGKTDGHYSFFTPYKLLQNDLPLRVGMMLDVGVTPAGQCAELAFSGPAPTAPACTISRLGATSCKTP